MTKIMDLLHFQRPIGQSQRYKYLPSQGGFEAYNYNSLCEGTTKTVENYQNKIALKMLQNHVKTLQAEYKRFEAKINGEKHALQLQYRDILAKDVRSDTERSFLLQAGFRYHRTGEPRHSMVEAEANGLKRAISEMHRSLQANRLKLRKSKNGLREDVDVDIEAEIRDIEAGLKDILDNEDLKKIRDNIRQIQTNTTFLRSHKNDPEVGMMDIKRWADVDGERNSGEILPAEAAKEIEKKLSSEDRWRRLALRHSCKYDCVACEFNLRCGSQDRKILHETTSPPRRWQAPPSGFYLKSSCDTVKPASRRQVSIVPGDVCNDLKAQEMFQNRRLQIWHKSECKLPPSATSPRALSPLDRPPKGKLEAYHVPKEDNSYDEPDNTSCMQNKDKCGDKKMPDLIKQYKTKLDMLKQTDGGAYLSDSALCELAPPKKMQNYSDPLIRREVKSPQFKTCPDDLVDKQSLPKLSGKRGFLTSPDLVGGDPGVVESENISDSVSLGSDLEKRKIRRARSSVKRRMIRESDSNAYKIKDFLDKIPQDNPSVARWYTRSGASTSLTAKCQDMRRKPNRKTVSLPNAVRDHTSENRAESTPTKMLESAESRYGYIAPFQLYHSKKKPVVAPVDRNSFDELIKCQYLRIPESVLQRREQTQDGVSSQATRSVTPLDVL